MVGHQFIAVLIKLLPVLVIMCVTDVDCMGCYPKCSCTATTVTCQGANLSEKSIKDLTEWLPRTVAEIKITGNKIRELPKNMFGNCSHNTTKHYENLKKLDLSGNAIEKIHGMTFHCIPNLEVLSLADNNWILHDHTGVFSTLPKLYSLNLTNCFRDRYNNSAHVTKMSWVFYDCDMSEIRFLYVGSNEFQIYTPEAAKALCTLPKLQLLDMSRNNLSDPVFSNCSRNLKYLDLSYNYIEHVSPSMMATYDSIQRYSHLLHPHGLTIDFRHNEWDCDCHLKDFVQWIKTTNVTIFHKEKLSCHDGQHLKQKLVDLDPSKLQCVGSSDSSSKSSNAGVVVLIVILVIIVCVAVVLLFIKRDRVKIYWKRGTDPLKNAYYKRKSQFGYSSVSTINT